MDRMYLQVAIERIEKERGVHHKKFGDKPLHNDCLPRFDKVIDMLRAELIKLDKPEPAKDIAQAQSSPG